MSGCTCVGYEACGAPNGSAIERFSFQTIEHAGSTSQLTLWLNALLGSI
jgi:hypothetical protein